MSRLTACRVARALSRPGPTRPAGPFLAPPAPGACDRAPAGGGLPGLARASHERGRDRPGPVAATLQRGRDPRAPRARATASTPSHPSRPAAKSAAAPASCCTSTSSGWAASSAPANACTATGTQASGAGWECVHVAIDDATRLAYVEVLADEREEAVVGFLARALAWFAGLDGRVGRVMTDNGAGYRSAPAPGPLPPARPAPHLQAPRPAAHQRLGGALHPHPGRAGPTRTVSTDSGRARRRSPAGCDI